MPHYVRDVMTKEGSKAIERAAAKNSSSKQRKEFTEPKKVGSKWMELRKSCNMLIIACVFLLYHLDWTRTDAIYMRVLYE